MVWLVLLTVSFQRRKPPWKADGRVESRAAASLNIWVENIPWKQGSASVEMPVESCRERGGGRISEK